MAELAYAPGDEGPPSPGAGVARVRETDAGSVTVHIGVPPLESTIVVVNQGQETHRFAIDARFERVIVGRSQLSDASVRNPRLSRRHFQLTRDSVHGLLVTDLESSGGTWLGGRRITEGVMNPGEVVAVGHPAHGVLVYTEHTVAGPGPSSDPLLQAILADPADRDARLVYADRLDQQGDPRAELIRYQIAVEDLPAGNPRRDPLEAQIRALLQAHEAAWLAPLPVPVVSWTFRGGFIEEVRVGDADSVTAVEAALRAYHPIRRVTTLLHDNGLT